MTEIPIPTPELVKIDQLQVDKQNPNRMTPKQHAALADSIRRYGFIVPIITNKDLLIADGEQRWIVAQALGMEQVPVIRLPVEDVDRRLLRQVLNKLRGEHELIADAQEFDRIIQMDRQDDLKTFLQLTDFQIDRYLAKIQELREETYQIPEIDKIPTNIHRGDMYSLGAHRVMCGDATNDQDVTRLLDGKKPIMTFTDPPYGRGGYVGRSEKHIPVAEDNKEQVLDHLRPIDTTIPCYICCDWKIFHFLVLAKGLPNSLIVWDKEFFGMGKGYRHQHEFIAFYGEIPYDEEIDVWHIRREPDRYHPTQKPLAVCERAIRNSTPLNSLVLDLYGGSGSTLLAAERIGRYCYMMEIDPRYCQVIINRWESYTSQKAVKCSPNKPVTESNPP